MAEDGHLRKRYIIVAPNLRSGSEYKHLSAIRENAITYVEVENEFSYSFSKNWYVKCNGTWTDSSFLTSSPLP